MKDIIIKINGREYNAEFSPGTESEVIINGKSFNVELLKNYNHNIFSFSINNRLLQTILDFRENAVSYIIADGFTHEIEIQDETSKILKKYLLESGSESDSKHAKIKAPMPGMVVKIPFSEGSHVTKGDKVIIIEAMKMENALSAPISGKITLLKASEGTAVEKDAVLMEIEAD